MSRVFHDLKVGLDEDLKEKLEWLVPNLETFHVYKKSVDARRRHDPHFVYSVEAYEKGEAIPDRRVTVEPVGTPTGAWQKPLIIGAGPAGLFAALRFVERGLPCVLIEQGSETIQRMKAINRFWRYGELDPRNNVGFGEGGAGLYSDGKLITRIKSPYVPYVMDRLVQFGAPEEIRYLANPHVGSDRIRRVIPKMREFLLANGCDIHFDTKVEALLCEGQNVKGVLCDGDRKFLSQHVILATGHSSEDMFKHLHTAGVYMEGKSFAMGLRIEHPQRLINEIQYRGNADHPALGAANYKLTYHNSREDFGVYSFCMCPGGYVLSCATAEGQVVSNGMSNYSRGSAFANSAVVVSIDHERTFGKDIWGGVKLRDQLEQQAFAMVQAAGGTKQLPVQKLTDFLARRSSGLALPSSSPSHVVAAPLHDLMPANMTAALDEGLHDFVRKMPSFLSEHAQLHGIESRTSCPVRIKRDDESLQSISHQGLYPCGEGAGYAGGITSAACDGIRVAEKIVEAMVGKTLLF